VLSRGVPGANSSELLHRLEEELAIFQPHVVLVLAGMNNRWNIAHATVPPPWRGTFFEWFARCSGLRLSRLVMWIAASLRHPTRELAVNSVSEEAYRGLALSRILAGEHSPEVESLLTAAIASNPHSSAAYRLRGVFHLIGDQRAEAQEDFQRAVALTPSLADSVMDFGWSSRYPQQASNYISRWLAHDLEAMRTLTASRHAELVLMTYPTLRDDEGIAETIRTAAARYDLRLVDLAQHFVSIPEAHRQHLVASDGVHLNVAGYHFIAEHVAEALMAQSVQPKAFGE
jgi:lysophospholipase L1-like esterase